MTDHFQNALDRNKPILHAQAPHPAKPIAQGQHLVIPSHDVEQRNDCVHRPFSGKQRATQHWPWIMPGEYS
jgi:hypothetical protein